MKKLRVLVCDDSAVSRRVLCDIINSDPQLEVLDAVADPYFAAQRITREIPDVITLDIEMPRMNGITFLKTLMSQYPMPVVIISSFTEKGSHLALKALELGAVEIVAKSEIIHTEKHIEESRIRVTDAVKAAYMVSVRKMNREEHNIATITKPLPVAGQFRTSTKLLAIGASTGGTEALRFFLKNYNTGNPGVVITQHMPPGFTRSFAENVNMICSITVKEAVNGEPILDDHAYIAPGGMHMEVGKSGFKYYIKIRDGELVNRHKPSVDVLFDSVATAAGKNAMGILMTGMGQDGARGLLKMRNAGAHTIAQDEASCVVFGMPREAIKLDAADKVLSLQDMPMYVMRNL